MKNKDIRIARYTPQHKELWDSFVDKSRNGTFLHKRGYMEYHSDRFDDHSLMFFKNGLLAAILPAHISNGVFGTHCGLTYGGLLIDNDTTATETLEMFRLLTTHLKEETDAKEIIYRPVPHIYHRYPCEEELYALFRYKATLTERKISSAIRLDDPLPFKGRRKLTAATKSRLSIVEDDNFAAFWEVLGDRLENKYGVAPVHNLQEIELLHNRFPKNIKLFRVTDGHNNTLAGSVLYITENVVHAQYTGSSHEGRRIGALDHLYSHLIRRQYAHMQYFDFGISVEDGGWYLNEGLIGQKEGFGGRAVMYDTYKLTIE